MDCNIVRELILQAEEGLDPDREVAMRRHLDHCRACRSFSEEFCRTWESLDQVPVIEPSAAFNAGVWHRIEQRRVPAWRRWLVLAPLPVMVRAAVILVLMVGAGVGGYRVFRVLSPASSADTLVFTADDQKDSQMLQELDNLMDFDESRLLSAYEEWDLENEVVDSGDPAPTLPQQKDNKIKGEVNIRLDDPAVSPRTDILS